jgi:transposase-like protein
MKRIPRRSYTEQYQQEAVRLASEVGPAEAARRLEMPVKTLNNWMRWSRRGKKWFSDEQTGTGNRAGSREPAVAGRERAAQGGARDPKTSRRVYCERVAVRYAFIEQQRGSYPLGDAVPGTGGVARRLCRLDSSRQELTEYRRRALDCPDPDSACASRGTYGSPRVTQGLKR